MDNQFFHALNPSCCNAEESTHIYQGQKDNAGEKNLKPDRKLNRVDSE